ncbi:MAG TPA: gliding motility-associated C-terminal domain-containing protein, partial [Bacteroidia bacterium]|nr:gliding motility-associated C-terminal domain-containing protein [Bacteroidia bacterium]
NTMGPIIDTSVITRPATCGKNNGSIEGLFADGATGYRWTDVATGNEVGSNADLLNIGPGIYRLEALHSSGCTVQSDPYTVTSLPLPVIDIDDLRVVPDTCQRAVGSISGLSVNGAGNGALYEWYDADGQLAGQGQELKNITAGTYRIKLTDANRCMVPSQSFIVENVTVQLPSPVFDNYTVPKGASFTMQPAATARGTYKLYDVPVGGTPLQEQAAGTFALPARNNDITYYIEIEDGNCLSDRVPVQIKVVDETHVSVPNAFSPNGDGLHDTWGLKLSGIMKLSYLRVYNRWGQVVFETSDAARRWNGTVNGKPLPVGTYYWILKGTDHNGLAVSGKGPLLIVR